MCERVRDPRWVHAQFSRDVADDVISRDVNIFFIKLHLLDPTAVLPAFNSLARGRLQPTVARMTALLRVKNSRLSRQNVSWRRQHIGNHRSTLLTLVDL